MHTKKLANKSGRIFLRSTNLRYKILPTNLDACKTTFYTIYKLHLRWNSTIKHCFYHTDLGQNAVFQNFEIQIALIQYSGRSKHAWAFGETAKNFSKSSIRPTGCELWSVWMNINRVTLQHVYFLFSGFITMCNLQKRLIRAAFWLLLQAMFMSDWKQTAQRLKLQKRLLTINKRIIIRWNIYRDNNFHSRRQVLKCLWKSLFMF